MRNDSNPLIDLHIAEYSAITTRNTYYGTIAFGLWPALVIFLTLISSSALLNAQFRGLLVGVAAVGSELICIGWYFCVWEQFKNVNYLEAELKPRITSILRQGQGDEGPQPVFWTYELWQMPRKGPQISRLIGDWWAGALVLGTSGGLFLFGHVAPGSSRTIWIVALVLALALLLAAFSQMMERLKFEGAMKRAAGQVARSSVPKNRPEAGGHAVPTIVPNPDGGVPDPAPWGPGMDVAGGPGLNDLEPQ